MHCERCERLPGSYPERGTLFLSPAIQPSAQKLRQGFESLGLQHSWTDGLFRVQVGEGDLARFVGWQKGQFTAQELEDTRAFLWSGPGEPAAADWMTVESLQAVVAKVEGNWLLDILGQGALTTHFHPIRSAADPEQIFARECLLRASDSQGQPIPPGRIFDVARQAGLLFYLDREARVTAVKTAAGKGFSEKIFINFNPTSIYTPEYCLMTTMLALKKAGLKPEQVVFEVIESDYIRDTAKLLDIVRYYRDYGFGVALDDLGAGYSSINLLAKLKPDYVKLDMELIHGVDRDSYKSTITRNLLRTAQDLGIRTVAEGVETEGEWQWVKDAGADFVQGFLWGKPQA